MRTEISFAELVLIELQQYSGNNSKSTKCHQNINNKFKLIKNLKKMFKSHDFLHFLSSKPLLFFISACGSITSSIFGLEYFNVILIKLI